MLGIEPVMLNGPTRPTIVARASTGTAAMRCGTDALRSA
jgi:hypothetical protein